METSDMLYIVYTPSFYCSDDARTCSKQMYVPIRLHVFRGILRAGHNIILWICIVVVVTYFRIIHQCRLEST